MTLEPTYVIATLKELDSVLEGLRRHRGATGQSLREDLTHRWALERGLEVACGLLFDLFNHLLSSELGEYSETYEDSVRRSRDRGIVTDATGSRLKGMGQFRHILAHRYVQIDPDKVALNLEIVLAAFPVAMSEIRSWAESRARAPGGNP